MKEALNYIKKEKNYIITIFIITFIWGIITHGFMFANSALSHDSLMESIINDGLIDWKISLGRILYPTYIYLTRGILVVPWLIGIISLIYIAISSILILKIFDIDKDNHIMKIITPGILVANVTMISLCGVFIEDMDVDMFAMMSSVIAVFLWRKHKKGYLYGTIPLFISLGLYQSYLSMAISLIMIVSIIDLLKKEEFKTVFNNGLRAILMIILAGLIYIIILKLIPIIFKKSVTSGTYNSLDTIFKMSLIEIIRETILCYLYTIKTIIYPASLYPDIITILINIVLIVGAGYIILSKVFSKNIKVKEKILILLLIFLLPFSMNISRILTNGMSHDLMHYSLWLTNLFIILIYIFDNKKHNKLKMISITLITIILLGNVRMANTLYMMKEIAEEKTQSYMNRVIYSIESFEDYIPNKTKVVIEGSPNMNIEFNNATDNLRRITGAGEDFSLYVGEYGRYDYYLKMFQYANINIIENPYLDKIEQWEINNMPVYPNKGSIKYIDDILVVKLG